MGVHGLTTYLREKRRLLSQTSVLSSTSENPIPVVVDGWSFIYDLYITSNLPWVYGGEYGDFTRLIMTVVESWISVGLQIYFVFDGACPDLKFPTVISRLVQSHVKPAQLFFRTSAASRATRRFLSENRILPPLAYSTCIWALESLRVKTKAVEVHFADEEGDPYAVELAGRLGGYVIGKDSDFVIFHSEGYKGYIPIDEMVWQASLPDNLDSVDDDDGEFQTVRRPKAKRKPPSEPHAYASVGLVPPTGVEDLSLSITSYSPQVLADHLDLPVNLLPLFAALVGNDFSKETEVGSRRIQSLFFTRNITTSERIEKVANTMHSVISPQKRKVTLQVGSVMDLIERTVNSLLSRLPPTLALGSGEIELIVDKIVNATLQYAIPKYSGKAVGRDGLWSNKVCAMHDPEVCSLLPIISRNVVRQTREASQADPNLLRARERYLNAYRMGLFSSKNMDTLNTGSSWARLFLENPDMETVARSIGRGIRRWIHSILDDTVGLDVQSDDAGSEDSPEASAGDDDEVIDVVESDSDDSHVDYLAPLKGELDRLHGEVEDDTPEPPPSITSHRRLHNGRPLVTEYFRSGTRIASETIVVKPITELLSSISLAEYAGDDEPPLVLRSEDDRLTILLRALKSDHPSVRSLSPLLILPVLAARWVIHSMHTRFLETGSRTREMERWTSKETRCLLSSFICESNDSTETGDERSRIFPSIENRNVQLMAQALMALETIEQFAQVLLLTRCVKSEFHRFSGKTFHSYLTGTKPLEENLPPGVWQAVETQLVHAFQKEVVVKKKTKAEKSSVASVPKVKPVVGSRGSFALLGDLTS